MYSAAKISRSGIRPNIFLKFSNQFIFFPVKRSIAMLINNPNHNFLKELGLSEQNQGVFDGTWHASGKIIESLNPATNGVIAKVLLVSNNYPCELYVNACSF